MSHYNNNVQLPKCKPIVIYCYTVYCNFAVYMYIVLFLLLYCSVDNFNAIIMKENKIGAN